MSEFWLKVDKTLRHYQRKLTCTARNAVWQVRRQPADRPVFVVGCSRAGTTLVYKTLSEATELGSLQRETHDFWMTLHPLAEKQWNTHALNAKDAKLGERDFVSRYFYAHTGKHRFVDKNNQNGLCVPYLHTLFPDAHFVYVKRSPGDNINSLIEGWGKPEEFATWSLELREKVAVEAGRYSRWCFFLSEGWRNYLQASIEEVSAFQYRTMNEAIVVASRAIPPAQWHEVCYEDLVKQPVAGFREMFESCGLAFTPALELHCAKVLDTPYNAFSEIRLDKWRDGRNRERIERAIPSVLDVAKKMGYAF